ncbi:MAG TPA: prolyl oligopeptidase family serine peptidase, partial [Chloroflexota bacterium]
MATPPVARVDVVRDTYFGTVIEDPYRWMEDTRSEDSRAFIAGQAAYARELLDAIPEREELLTRIGELRSAVPVVTSPQIAGGRAFYLRRDPEDDLAKLVVRVSADAPEKVLLDPNALAGEAHTAIDWYRPSRDGSLVAYGVSQGGSEDSTLYVLDVDGGETLRDAITRTQFSGDALWWLEDNRSFVYHRLADVPDSAPQDERYLNARAHLHRLGTDPDDDPAVFGRGVHPDIEISPVDLAMVIAPKNGDWMFGIVVHGVLNELTIYVAHVGGLLEPAACPWKLVADTDDAVTDLAHDGDTAYLLTYRDAPRYKVLATDLNAPDLSTAQVAVPEGDVVVQAITVVGGYLVTRDLAAGVSRLRRVSLEGGTPERIPLPFEGAVTGWAHEAGSPDLYLQLQSWTESPRMFRYDANAGTCVDTGWVPAGPVDLGEIEVVETAATGRDGVAIPLTIIHRRGLKLDGSNPTLLKGYGSYGLNYPIVYQPQMLAWYERGGVQAIARIRGGGELGRRWHEAGRLLNKQNTIDDFISCAEYLIEQQYTRSDRLAGEGRSAGGIPTGGALIQRPDLWAVMVMHVAVTDAFRMQYEPNGPMNIPEFGDVNTPEGFAALQIIDVCSRVREGVAYP